MTQKLWRWAERAAVPASFASIVAYGILEVWFLKNAPTEPVAGAAHAIKWRGATIYLTDAQQLATDILFWGGPLLLLAAVFVNLGRKCFWQPPISLLRVIRFRVGRKTSSAMSAMLQPEHRLVAARGEASHGNETACYRHDHRARQVEFG